jgi:hypothetical protein
VTAQEHTAAVTFYAKIFSHCLFNVHAVRKGYFDTLFCETNDPTINIRWRAAVPKIIENMHSRKRLGWDF